MKKKGLSLFSNLPNKTRDLIFYKWYSNMSQAKAKINQTFVEVSVDFLPCICYVYIESGYPYYQLA